MWGICTSTCTTVIGLSSRCQPYTFPDPATGGQSILSQKQLFAMGACLSNNALVDCTRRVTASCLNPNSNSPNSGAFLESPGALCSGLCQIALQECAAALGIPDLRSDVSDFCELYEADDCVASFLSSCLGMEELDPAVQCSPKCMAVLGRTECDAPLATSPQVIGRVFEVRQQCTARACQATVNARCPGLDAGSFGESICGDQDCLSSVAECVGTDAASAVLSFCSTNITASCIARLSDSCLDESLSGQLPTTGGVPPLIEALMAAPELCSPECTALLSDSGFSAAEEQCIRPESAGAPAGGTLLHMKGLPAQLLEATAGRCTSAAAAGRLSYISSLVGCPVFVDSNENGRKDPTEPSATTDGDGMFVLEAGNSLSGPVTLLMAGSGQEEVGPDQPSTKCMDAAALAPPTVPLRTPYNCSSMSAMSTLQMELTSGGWTMKAEQLGVPLLPLLSHALLLPLLHPPLPPIPSLGQP